MDSQKSGQELDEHVDPYLWNPIYKELTKLVGIEVTLKIYQEYRGSQLTLPMRLVDHHYLPQILESEYNGQNLRKIARYYGYSERHLRRILNGMKTERVDSKKTGKAISDVTKTTNRGEKNE